MISNKNENKLDNPVWHSLSESHKYFSCNYKYSKFYHPDYCPFGGYTSVNIAEDIFHHSLISDNFFIVGNKPELSEAVKFKTELVSLQMIIKNKINTEIKDNITPLTEKHRNALSHLVNLVQPGYFKKHTCLLGNFYGIFKKDRLVAAAGERMQMNDFIEVSAIVTHPVYTNNGYAKQLTAHAVNAILRQNKIPYLHVLETNTKAMSLYEKVGFKVRRKLSFWHIKKTIKNVDTSHAIARAKQH